MKNTYFLKTTNIKPNKAYPLLKIFKNLEKSKVLRILIPEKNKRTEFLKRQKILFSKKCTCCNVFNENYITFPYNYWIESPVYGFYLDIIHEITHCWQKEKEKINFRALAKKFEYWENSKELEAYAYSLIEAKSIGLSKADFRKYIEEDDFLSKKEIKMLYYNILKLKIK